MNMNEKIFIITGLENYIGNKKGLARVLHLLESIGCYFKSSDKGCYFVYNEDVELEVYRIFEEDLQEEGWEIFGGSLPGKSYLIEQIDIALIDNDEDKYNYALEDYKSYLEICKMLNVD